MHQRICAVYLLTNDKRTVLYTGVTADLVARTFQHRTAADPSAFTARYRCWRLVYYEPFDHISAAIAREKQIKAGSRARKESLVATLNPSWRDLFEDLC